MNRLSALRCLALAAVAITALVTAAPAAAQDDIAVTFVVEDPNEGETNEMVATVGGDYARLDMGPEASMIFTPSAMVIVQHAERMYIEFTQEMMDRMAQMMGAMGREAAESADLDDFDPTGYSFDVTGNTDTIMGHEAREVAMSGPEGQQGSLWIAESASVGFFEVWGRMADHLAKMSGPFMGGGSNPAASMQNYLYMARLQGLPPGAVLRVTTDGGEVITVTNVSQGPLGDDWKSPPGDYTKQDIPMMPR